MLLANFMIIVARGLVNTQVAFQQEMNSENVDRNPVKFVISNREKIINIYRIGFLVGVVCALFAIWFLVDAADMAL